MRVRGSQNLSEKVSGDRTVGTCAISAKFQRGYCQFVAGGAIAASDIEHPSHAGPSQRQFSQTAGGAIGQLYIENL